MLTFFPPNFYREGQGHCNIMLLCCRSVLGQIDRQACVFTFGYGSEHDADLLHALAEAGNGLFYYIDSSESIPDSFCDCLGGLLSVAAQVCIICNLNYLPHKLPA